MVTVGVVIHNIGKRSAEMLSMTIECIEGLKRTADEPYELILCDNGSDDVETMKFLFNEKMAIVHRNIENEPLAKCWNVIVQGAKGEIVFLINSDIVFHKPGWMSGMVKQLYGGCSVIGPHVMGWNGFSFVEGSLFAFFRNQALEIAENGKVFDERFEFTCEDVDFCHRMERSGKRLCAFDNAQDYWRHVGHGTLCWCNEDPAFGGRSILDIMHEARRKLSRKWGRAEMVNDW